MFCSTTAVFFSCSNGQVEKIADNKNIDSTKVNLGKTNNENATDSSVVAILSPEGKLLREQKYLTEKVQQSGMPEFANYIKGYPTSDTIIGDFNGDGKMENAWFIDKGVSAFEKCKESGDKNLCEGIIQFSDKKINQLVIENCPMGIFKNEKDLNGDGKDEIGILPYWFSSGCRQYDVFSLKDTKWILVCAPISNTYNMREAGIVLIEKDKNRNGYAMIRESVDSYVSLNPKNKLPIEFIQGSSCQWSNVIERSIKLK